VSIAYSKNRASVHEVFRVLVLPGLLLLVSACTETPPPAEPINVPTFQPKPQTQARQSSPLVAGPVRQRGATGTGPAPPVTAPAATAVNAAPSRIPLKPTAEALSLEQVALPAFVNEIFSKTLNLTVQIDQRVLTRTDVLTLRTGRPLPAEDLFRMAEHILAGYGIGVGWDGSVIHIAPEDALMAQMPDLIRSRALPEVPVALRPVFQVVDLHQVSAADISAWLTNAYGANVKVSAVGKTPAVMLFGLPENVRAAVEAVGVLDQARLAGRESLRVTPVYWAARDLAAKLSDIMRAEGYEISVSAGPSASPNAPIILIPIEANNTLIAFAADPKILVHIRQWAGDLDQAGRADPLRSVFIYLVQNTTAASLGQIVQGVLGGRIAGPTTEVPLERAGATRLSTGRMSTASATPPASMTPAAGGASPPRETATAPASAAPAGDSAAGSGQATQPDVASSGTSNARLVIDQARNALVLIGTAQDYQRIRPVLEALDKAPREALIEVTVAELTLNQADNLGLDWTSVNRLGGGMVQRLGTGTNVLPGGVGGLPLGTSGFNYAILNGVGDVRVILNAFSSDNHLSFLSTPRILAKSGSEARIEVGTEVPIVTSQGSTNTIQNAGTTGILQSIDYRKTGVLLAVRPVIHAANRIDLTVSQEVSAALPNTTPGISTPLIQNRNVATELSLSDGQTVVIGGLISESRTANDSGVPYLKDLPGVGNLFRNQSLSKEKTELLVFITPYVISGDADAAAITQQFQEQMRRWPVPSTQLRW
jgi:general secretion pathway protein D